MVAEFSELLALRCYICRNSLVLTGKFFAAIKDKIFCAGGPAARRYFKIISLNPKAIRVSFFPAFFDSNISEATCGLMKEEEPFVFENRGTIEAKVLISMYLVEMKQRTASS